MTTSGKGGYNRNFGGKLTLKGGIQIPNSKPKSTSSGRVKALSGHRETKSTVRLQGTGRIVSTGKTVQGFETKFHEQVRPGDLIIVTLPTSCTRQTRKVDAVLSNKTLTIDEGFETDLITTSNFYIQRQSAADDYTKDEQAPTFESPAPSTVTIREKSGMWSYRNVTKTLKNAPSAEERLNERIKSSRDKYCW